MATLGSLRTTTGAERRFYGGMAVAILAVAVLGFARTYFLRPILPVPTPAPLALTHLVHLHAVLFTTWVVLLFIQTRLVAARRIDLHRRLGVIAAGMAIVMVVVGVLVALHAVHRGIAPFGMDPHRFLVVPLVAITLFAVLVVAGMRARRRDAQAHKRYMLLGTIALLPPAVARWALLLGLGPPIVLAVATLFVVPLFVWDWKALGRIHAVTLWGGLLIAVSGPARLLIARTDTWVAVANWLAGLVQ
ncbi:MAG: hypothetical protein WBM03_05555 [Steroidobacteraceae bacterium]